MERATPLLRSYIGGGWRTAEDEGTPLRDAVTGDQVARISSKGIDRAAALDYGRRVGGPALRELTFHQRAALLKALASHLREHRDELYALSARTGATQGDSKFDVDGGIGVLFSYASKGRRELPNDTVYLDGAVEPLGKGGTFVGQHVCTPLRGVAVQINAFNFPVWGPLEKFAPAFLAGVPSLIKPASQTAYLTEKLVELMIDSGLLPDGSLQLLCGDAGDLLDHVTSQDLVSFTGSAATAQRLRAHPTIVRNAVRFNAEADSLNCSILGPDATPGTPEFDLYVSQLVTEMTVKAGQKCTAIRRALVPAALLDDGPGRERAVGEGHGGKPGRPGRMGALASLEQREVRRSLKALQDAGRIVFGDHVDVVDADPARRVPVPVLLRADDPSGANRMRWAFGRCRPAPSVEQVELAAEARAAWPVRSSPATPTSRGRWCSARLRGTAGCWCSTPTTPGSPQGTVRRCRCWSTVVPAGRAAVRRWAVSVGCCTTCNARPCRPAPRC